MVTISSNIGEVAAWFDSLVASHKAQSTSALRNTRVNLQLSLTNEAKATRADGTTFEYFDAVDRGRKAIDLRGTTHWVVFGSTAKNTTFTQHVKASSGLHITARSLAQIYTQFDG